MVQMNKGRLITPQMVLNHDQNTLFNKAVPAEKEQDAGCMAATQQPSNHLVATFHQSKPVRASPRDKKAHKNRAQADKLLKKVLMDQKGEKSVTDPKSAMQSILSNKQVFSFPIKRTRRQE